MEQSPKVSQSKFLISLDRILETINRNQNRLWRATWWSLQSLRSFVIGYGLGHEMEWDVARIVKILILFIIMGWAVRILNNNLSAPSGRTAIACFFDPKRNKNKNKNSLGPSQNSKPSQPWTFLLKYARHIKKWKENNSKTNRMERVSHCVSHFRMHCLLLKFTMGKKLRVCFCLSEIQCVK